MGSLRARAVRSIRRSARDGERLAAQTITPELRARRVRKLVRVVSNSLVASSIASAVLAIGREGGVVALVVCDAQLEGAEAHRFSFFGDLEFTRARHARYRELLLRAVWPVPERAASLAPAVGRSPLDVRESGRTAAGR
jgi:hypothetical protein